MKQKLKNFHKNFVESIKNLRAKVNFDFSYVLNGISIDATGDAINKIITMPSVKGVYKEKHTRFCEKIVGKLSVRI